MNIAFLIFDKLTALDAVGPYEVLSRLPGAKVEFVAKEAGAKLTDTGMLSLIAERSIADVDPADVDILLIPGGEGNRPMLEDEEILDWVRAVHAGSEWTTSVCTGSMVLGAAGRAGGAPGHHALGLPGGSRQVRRDARLRARGL